MNEDIPAAARMTPVRDTLIDVTASPESPDTGNEPDHECEFCLNTEAWD